MIVSPRAYAFGREKGFIDADGRFDHAKFVAWFESLPADSQERIMAATLVER